MPITKKVPNNKLVVFEAKGPAEELPMFAALNFTSNNPYEVAEFIQQCNTQAKTFRDLAKDGAEISRTGRISTARAYLAKIPFEVSARAGAFAHGHRNTSCRPRDGFGWISIWEK
jgi:hypothetical protein